MDLIFSTDQVDSYQINTPVYQGPLDLLLQLIENAELDITSLALSQVTEQFLKHLEKMQELPPDEISAFLVIAAKLIQIKSEALLPRQSCLRRRVSGSHECPPRRRADGVRKMHGQKLALVVTPFPESDCGERNGHDDVGRRHARAQCGRNGQAGQVRRDRGPALVLERVYHGARRSLELHGVEHFCFSARGFSRAVGLGQGESPGPGAQLARAR